jgi:hypothetical protein
MFQCFYTADLMHSSYSENYRAVYEFSDENDIMTAPKITPWTGDQSVARPLPKHRTTPTQNKPIETSMP